MQNDATVKTILIMLFLAVANPTACIKCNAQTPREQTSFCADEGVLLATPPPQTVVTAIMNSREARQATLDASTKPTEVDLAKLLKGTTVHLSNSPSRFFVVMGSELPLSGVDNTWFWIVQETGQNATVLLWAGANCLHIESTKTHGYRDVLVRWSVAAGTKTDIYKFDGTSYKLRRTHWHENKP